MAAAPIAVRDESAAVSRGAVSATASLTELGAGLRPLSHGGATRPPIAVCRVFRLWAVVAGPGRSERLGELAYGGLGMA